MAQAAGVYGVGDGDALAARARAIAAATAGNINSMWQDALRGRRTEVDYMNGYVNAMGARLGVPTPVNATLTALIRVLEQGRESDRGDVGHR